MQHLDTAQLATYLNVTKRTIQRKAIKNKWPYTEQIGLGGTKRLYLYSALPPTIKNKIVAAIIVSHEGKATAAIGKVTALAHRPLDPNEFYKTLCTTQPANLKHVNKYHLKLGLLALARQFVADGQFGKIEGFDTFCQQYNNRTVDVAPFVYGAIAHVSRITLLRWEKKELDLCNAVAQSCYSPIEETLKAVVQEVVLLTPSITPQRLQKYLTTLFYPQGVPNEQRLAQWLVECRAFAVVRQPNPDESQAE